MNLELTALYSTVLITNGPRRLVQTINQENFTFHNLVASGVHGSVKCSHSRQGSVSYEQD